MTKPCISEKYVIVPAITKFSSSFTLTKPLPSSIISSVTIMTRAAVLMMSNDSVSSDSAAPI